MPVDLIKVIKRWPAIILAINRIAKVPGRIIILIDSIKTINDIKALGVPVGMRWASICFVLLIQPKIKKDSQRGRERVRFIIIWLVLVKI